MPSLTPFAQIQGSLPPLIPKPAEQKPPQTVVFAPVHAPTTHEAPDLTPLQGIPQAQAPQAVFASAKPIEYVPTDPLAEEQQHLQALQEKDYQKDLHPWGTAENHPGVFGKIMHALSVATGGPNRRAMMEQERDRQINPLMAEQSDIAQKAALEKEEEAQTKKLGEPDSTLVPTSDGYETFNPHEENPQLHPLTGDNEKPAMPYVKPGPMQHVALQDASGQPMAATYRDGQYFAATTGAPIANPKPYEKPGAEKNIQAKTLKLPNGKQVAGKVDSKGNLLLGDGTSAPKGTLLYQQPNYGMEVLPSKTITVTDPATGLPTVEAYNPATKQYERPQGTAASGTYAHQLQSAAAINRMLYKSVYPLVATMEKKGELGVIQGRFEDWLNRDVGNANPDVAQFHQLMNGVVSIMMGMYGFRRQEAVQNLSAQLGARMTPESLKAALSGIEQHADSIIGEAIQNGGQGGSNAAGNGATGGGKGNQPSEPLGDTNKPDGVYEMNGKRYRVKGKKVYAD